MTTTTIKIKESQKVDYGTMFLLGILADDKLVGSASVYKYHGKDPDGDAIQEAAKLERIDIEDEHQRKGYGTAAIKALTKKFGEIVAAPDNEDARRLYERIGEDVLERGRAEDEWMLYLDIGFGVYVFS